MIKGKLGWHNSLKIMSIISCCICFVVTIVAIITKQNKFAIIIISILTTLGLILSLYLLVYKIYVYEDKIKFVSIFRIKEYNYSNIIIKPDISIIICDINNKELLRISSFIDSQSIILKWYNSYCKRNNIKYDLLNKKMKCNFYVKNFSIFGCIYSIITFIFFILSIYLENKSLLDDVVDKYIFLILGIIVIIPSLYSLLLYLNFEIIWIDDYLVFKNFLGIKKEFKINTLECEYTDKTIKIKFPNKRKKILLYYFLDNKEMLLFAVRGSK